MQLQPAGAARTSHLLSLIHLVVVYLGLPEDTNRGRVLDPGNFYSQIEKLISRELTFLAAATSVGRGARVMEQPFVDAAIVFIIRSFR